MTQITRHSDRAAFIAAVADLAAAALEAGCVRRPNQKAFAAIAGGSTPLAALPHLFHRPLAWGRIALTVSDERWVPVGHDAHNMAAVQAAVQRTPAAEGPVEWAPLSRSPSLYDDDIDRAARVANDALAYHAPLDLLWAGMGADGHALSWFPGPDLDRALTSERMVEPVRPDPLPPEAPHARLTLTLAAAREAAVILLAATGEDKRAVLDNPAGYPVAHLLDLPQTVVHWAP